MTRPGTREGGGGTFYGVGVGPGDPALLTLKAHRLAGSVPVLAYIANGEGYSMARAIAATSIAAAPNPDRIELPVTVAMCNDRDAINMVYDRAAVEISAHLARGDDVAFLCEGDPLFFGSFAYLLDRLAPRHAVEVVPGISSIHAAAARLARPFGRLAESVAVVSGRHDDARILAALRDHDNVAIMKPGRGRARIAALIERAGRAGNARYVEHLGGDDELLVDEIAALDGGPGPYFSLFLVTREPGGAG